MKTWIAALLCCALSALVPAVPPAQADGGKTATDTVPTVLRAMLVDYRRYAETLWHSPATLPGMGYWGTGRSDWNNEGTRSQSTTALVYALLWREGDHSINISDRVEPALLYAAATHVTGDRMATDGKRWGDAWQSAMWAGNLGVTAWLVQDQLSPATLAAVKRVVAHEADVFIGKAPPSMEPGDTKAEENAWDLTAPAAAVLLMPDDPHAAAWQEAVQRYGFNTLSVESDKMSKRVVDGKPISEWVTTEQLNPDFTLENHGIFHPVYAMVAPATMAQSAVAYRLAGKPIPGGLEFNVLREWDMLKYITLPDGEWVYPQGLDWELHDYEHIHYWTMLATLYKDRAAAVMEQRMAGYARRRQLINGDGRFVGPTSFGFGREAVQAERVAYALMEHEVFGPPPVVSAADYDNMVKTLDPAHIFAAAGFALQRSNRGILSFSWKNRLMGLAVPESETHLDTPYVTTPYEETVVGGFSIEGMDGDQNRAFKILKKTVAVVDDGFVGAIDAVVCAGRLDQNIAVATAAPGILIYLDRVTALKDVTVTEERGLVLGIENDDVSGNMRTITSQDGSAPMPGGHNDDAVLRGNWADVDGRLGLVTAASPTAGLLYRRVEKPNRSGARQDFLIGAFRNDRRSFKAGDVVAMRAGVFLPDATNEETAKVAADVTVTNIPGGRTLHVTGPAGRSFDLTLNDDGTASWQGKLLK